MLTKSRVSDCKLETERGHYINQQGKHICNYHLYAFERYKIAGEKCYELPNEKQLQLQD